MFVNVHVQRYCDECDGESLFGPRSSTMWSVEGISVSNTQTTEFSVPINFTPEKGETLFVVYAVWSSGDSFGHDEGYGLEIFTVVRSNELAEENKKNLKNAKPYANIIHEGRVQEKVHVPWNGYFESLDYVDIARFNVKE